MRGGKHSIYLLRHLDRKSYTAFKDTGVRCMLCHPLQNGRHIIHFAYPTVKNKPRYPVHLFWFWWQHITHLRILLRHIHLNEVKSSLLWKNFTAGKGSAADPGYSAGSPDTWATWLCWFLSVGSIVNEKDAVWKLWQDPKGKSPTMWDPGILEWDYVMYSENIICLLRNPMDSGARSCQNEAINYHL